MQEIRKIITTLLMIPAMVATSAQTEKKGFDDLYHFIENLDVFNGVIIASFNVN